ncbi:MAG: DUF58 domain-containing protein [Candidatus Sumerlaeaceae bacterium]|nr:DUF58 domain-containing protein [Candidatus Sumerlaeaceae bacterium]
MSPYPREEMTIRLSTRQNAILFLTTFLIFSGIGMGSRAVTVAGLFLLTLVLLDWFAGSRALRAISVKRRHFPRAFENDSVAVDIEVLNSGNGPANLLEVTDSFAPGNNYLIRSMALELPPHSRMPFRYEERCSRGRGLHLVGPMRLRLGSPLGLFVFRDTRDDVSTITVYPQAASIPHFAVLGNGTHFNIGEQVVQRIGRSEEFASLRGYRPGDPPRLIHWPSSARHQTLLVKEFARNVVTEVTIYIDLAITSVSGLGGLSSAEYRIKAAAAIATETIRKHHLCKLVAARSPRKETSLGGGQRHLITMLDWLALIKPEGEASLETELIGDSRRLKPGATVVLVMSSIHFDPAQLEQALRLLKTRQVRAIAVVVDDRTFVKLRSEQEQFYAKAPPLDHLIAFLRNSGCDVFTLGISENIGQKLGIPA